MLAVIVFAAQQKQAFQQFAFSNPLATWKIPSRRVISMPKIKMPLTSTPIPAKKAGNTSVPNSQVVSMATPTQYSAASSGTTGGIWKPAVDTSWQLQLTAPVDQSVNAQVYDIDGFDNSASVVSSLHAQGKRVICYMDAGTYENWRSDAKQIPSSVKGNGVEGWEGEQWLDVRNMAVLSPIMQARMDICQQKGFDGIDFDNVDGYSNNSGFALTASDQITYNTWLAKQAHQRGLAVGLKNDLDQIPQLVSSFEWIVDEQCFEYKECDKLTPFISADKPVFEVEYSLDTNQFCSQANASNFNSLKKKLDLDAPRTACR